MADVAEKILMKVADMVGIGFVDLSDTFRFDNVLETFAVNFCVKGKFDRIYDATIELFEVDTPSIAAGGLFYVFVYLFVCDKS